MPGRYRSGGIHERFKFRKEIWPTDDARPAARATDRGRTGDKVDHFDPAAAPLGTDEEAGGGRLVVSEDDIRRATTPPPVAAEPHRFFIWGFAPLFVIIGFVALGLILAGFVLFSDPASP
jgi:hypothetical protein